MLELLAEGRQSEPDNDADLVRPRLSELEEREFSYPKRRDRL